MTDNFVTVDAPTDQDWLNAMDYPWPSGAYIPHEPELPQDAFLWYQGLEALYGGAAGGGKSDALLMGALQYVDVPGYAAILLRKTYTELTLENALLDRSMKWLAHTDASWNGEHRRWTFPSSATLTFGFLQRPQDRARYQSAEFQYIGLDELTAFDESDYRFMFSRLRRPAVCRIHDGKHETEKAIGTWRDGQFVCELCGRVAPPNASVPTRMRAGTNPGGPGHKWVYDRFVLPYEKMQVGKADPNPNRIFVPAKLEDNPHVDQDSYRTAMHNLEPELAAQLLDGNWHVREPGNWMMRDPRWIDACVKLGDKMWEEHMNGTKKLPQPRAYHRGRVALGLTEGIDWGEHTQAYVIWPLGQGGIFIPPSEVVKIGEDPVQTTKAILEAAMRFPYPLQLACYDSAAPQSMRSFRTVARRIPRFKTMWTTGVPFKQYKKETIGYLRVLARRTYQGETERILAIHPSNEELIRQLKAWQRKDEESDEAVKKDDHGPDALVAGASPTASEYRAYVEKELAEVMRGDDIESYEVGIEEEGGFAYERA